MNEIKAFEFQSTSVRVVPGPDGEPRWVAKDVAEALGYAWNGTARIEHVPGKWRGVTSVVTPSGQQEMAFLSEQGLYFFVCRSDKPAALPFQEWLAGDVLPSIRKTGAYHTPGSASLIPETPLAMRMTADMLLRLADLREHIEMLQGDAMRTEQNIAALRAGEPAAATGRPMILGRRLYPQAMDAILAFAESREHVSMEQIFGEFLEGFERTRNNEMLVSRMLKDRGFSRTKITEGHRRIWVYAR